MSSSPRKPSIVELIITFDLQANSALSHSPAVRGRFVKLRRVPSNNAHVGVIPCGCEKKSLTPYCLPSCATRHFLVDDPDVLQVPHHCMRVPLTIRVVRDGPVENRAERTGDAAHRDFRVQKMGLVQ